MMDGNKSTFSTKDLPLLHWRQLYPAVESGIIAADKISAVLSWKTYIIKVNDIDYSDDLTKWAYDPDYGSAQF